MYIYICLSPLFGTLSVRTFFFTIDRRLNLRTIDRHARSIAGAIATSNENEWTLIKLNLSRSCWRSLLAAIARMDEMPLACVYIIC